MVDLTSANIETIIKSANAAPERRIAAILMHVSITDSLVSSYATELIITLTDPDGLSDGKYPLQTPIGSAVFCHLNDASDDLLKLLHDEEGGPADLTAAQLIIRSRTGSIPNNHSLDLVLKATTGKDSLWWLDWIAQNRSRN